MTGPQKVDKKDLPCILGLFAGTIVFLLIFSTSTSPLTSWLGWDSSIFTLLGRSLVDGKTPFKDIFDIKGPMIYFVEALGQLMAPWRKGSFLLQIPFDLLSVLFLYLTARLFLSRAKAMFAVALSMLFLAATLFGGNLTEEYCLTPAALCLWLALRLFRGRWDGAADRHPPVYALVYGLCSAFIIWIKITHATMIFGLVLYFTCSLLWNRQFKCLAYNALAYTAGLAIVSVPILLWFSARGALEDMLFGTFIVPVRYAMDTTASHDFMDTVNIVKDLAPALAVMFFVAVFRLYRFQLGRMLLCCAAISSAALFFGGAGYSHYFIVLTPYVTVGAAMMLSCQLEWGPPILRQSVPVILALYTLVLCAAATYLGVLPAVRYIFPPAEHSYVQEAEGFARQGELIPADERDSVLLIAGNVASRWYETNRIVPCYKYCVSSFIMGMPEAIRESEQMLEQSPPCWLGLQGYLLDSSGPFEQFLQGTLEAKYDQVSVESNICLYHLRSDADTDG